MKWETCIREHIVRQDTHKEVQKLREQSLNTFKTAQNLSVDRVQRRSKILLLYDAVRERLEAITCREGYDVHNHECYRAFLQECMNATDLAQQFNALRILRNKLEYDGYTLSGDEAQDAVTSLKKLFHELDTVTSIK